MTKDEALEIWKDKFGTLAVAIKDVVTAERNVFRAAWVLTSSNLLTRGNTETSLTFRLIGENHGLV